MKYIIDWSTIKNRYKGFEKLAVKYVQRMYDDRFRHTGDTRDGNKDALLIKDEGNCTIVVGFQLSKSAPEEWWMEAKYSTSEERLTRYRLDATLVSAILKGTVGRVIFVSNINIDAQTVNDIRQALTSATNCKEVNFCTKGSLEYWLYQNRDVLEEFFPAYSATNIELPDLVPIEQMDFYAADKSSLSFRESLSVLEMDRVYIAKFSVYANKSEKLPVQAASYLKGIRELQPREFSLDAGINNLELCFKLASKSYGYRSEKRKEEHLQLPAPVFRLGPLEVMPRKSVAVSTNPWKNLNIPSQDELLRKLRRHFEIFLKRDETQMLCVSGQSGVGKTHVLDAFIAQAGKSNVLIYSCELSESQTADFGDLIRCVNFLYFPYLPADSVNKDYLDALKSREHISQLYYDMICCGNDAETLGQLLSRYVSEDIRLFPPKFHVDPRLIIIDNIHMASNLTSNAIYKIVMELSLIHAPFLFIISGQVIKHTESYMELSKALPILEHELCVTVEDCLSLIPEAQASPEVRQLLQSNFLFSNTLELLFFTRYILDNGSKATDFNAFSVLYHLFFRENFIGTYINKLFKDAIQGNAAADALCNKVYWNPGGVDGADQPEGKMLLSSQVVRVASYPNRLVPYHDIYTAFYRKHYSCHGALEAPFVQLLETANTPAIMTAVKELHKMFKAQKYISVYYSLEPIYQDASSSKYRNHLEQTDYYTLFYEYARSCAYCSLDHSSRRMFKCIYEETKTLPQPSAATRKVCNAALWELTNSTFEALDYDKVRRYAEELTRNTCDLTLRGVYKGNPKDSVRYHNSNIICSMIKSELQESDSGKFFCQSIQEMMAHGFEDRAWSYCVRYSLTLMRHAPKETIRFLSACCAHYDKANDPTEKYLLWSHFYLAYMRMIVNDDRSVEDEALTYMSQLHDRFFNDYRKTLFGMATYFYYRGETEAGDRLLLSDSYVLREKRPRLQGFSHLAHAARHVVTCDREAALSELEKAFTIFENLPSYRELVEHNISLLKRDDISTDSLSRSLHYCLDRPSEKDVYYLDIRGCW